MAHLICQETGLNYSITDPRWRSDTGALLDLSPTLTFDPAALSGAPHNLWRYRSAMGLPAEAIPVSFGEGLTPLRPITIDGREVWCKCDHLFPSGSYKDRGAAVLLSHARFLGVEEVVQDSSGNAGAAVAHYAALAGLGCRIFVPADTSAAKLVQMRACGATVELVPGDREATAQAAMQAADTHFYASHVWQPMFFEGTKTWAYEVCEQRQWQAPDTVVLPAGNGTLLLGAYQGFVELQQIGLIDRLPRLIGVQAAHCAPLYAAQAAGEEQPRAIEGQPTTAEGIAIAVPRRGAQMMRYVRASGGRFLVVEEAEIVAALDLMARQGYFIEPTSAAVIAGLRQYLGSEAEADEQIVSVFTGHGLKAAEKIGKLLGKRRV
jgi:threonine synthase